VSQAPSKATIGTLDPFIQSLPSAFPFSKSSEGSKCHNLTETRQGPKFPQNLRPINLRSTTAKPFETVILKIFQKNIEERGLLNEGQFGFRARHSTPLQYMRLTDHVTLHFNNKISTAAVFLDKEKTCDSTWHIGIFDQLNQAYWLFSLTTIIHCFGGRRIVYAKGYSNKDATRFFCVMATKHTMFI
jgi:hypothetical protein